ncbi:hypothetical protein CEXT_50281 [Caerostris extrusa]|uniref:Uncharacterized protein n=1 Tax=Caerostris extrusa TaxID=172846 RepID=A0AAV4NAV2_CAEEX|nr:hypothetical protein CEXT_50281 [Caerostris extrusa]
MREHRSHMETDHTLTSDCDTSTCLVYPLECLYPTLETTGLGGEGWVAGCPLAAKKRKLLDNSGSEHSVAKTRRSEQKRSAPSEPAKVHQEAEKRSAAASSHGPQSGPKVTARKGSPPASSAWSTAVASPLQKPRRRKEPQEDI